MLHGGEVAHTSASQPRHAPGPDRRGRLIGARASRLWSFIREVVLEVDGAGRIATTSPSVDEYGYLPDDLVGTPVRALIHPDDRAPLEAYVADPVTAAGSLPTHLRLIAGDGRVVAAEASFHPVPPTSPTGVVITLRDLDDAAARIADRQRQALRQLHVIDAMKQRLLETMTREFRTPLSVIAGFAQTLQRQGTGFTPDHLERIGETIARQASRLDAVVADVMDLDHASRGSALAERERHDVAQIVLRATHAVPLGPRHLRLDLEPAVVDVDAHRLERIVDALLGNARCHTPAGTTVWVRVRPVRGGARIEVSDDGPGIPDDLKPDAFSPFTTGPTLGTAPPGLGVGLALVRRFAEAQGGHCCITDTAGGGTTVVVHLTPAARQVAAGNGAQPTTLPGRPAVLQARSLGADGTVRPETIAVIASMLRTTRRELGLHSTYLTAFTTTEQVVLAADQDAPSCGPAPGTRLPLDDTFCARMVRGEIGHVVPDVAREPALAGVAPGGHAPGCYVGVPVHLPDGHLFGSLYGVDDRARPDLTAPGIASLRTLAQVLGDQLGHRQVVDAERRELTQRIESALGGRDGFRVVYQPIVEVASGRVMGVEALARFPDRQVRSPDVWFAEAARVGLGGELEQATLVRALAGLERLPEHCYLSLNLSPGTICSGGLRPLLGRVPLDRIVVEITEHAAVTDYTTLATMLGPFVDAGVRLAIDDVGGGFASLRHVLRLRPAIIKIDRSLVGQVATDPPQRAIALGLAALGLELDAILVAEGVEDDDTLATLAEVGITHAQGSRFAPPGPLPLTTQRYEVPPRPRHPPHADGAARR